MGATPRILGAVSLGETLAAFQKPLDTSMTIAYGLRPREEKLHVRTEKQHPNVDLPRA
jgi:hypothetical protein